MKRPLAKLARPMALTAVPLLIAAGAAAGGPPWISLEYPPNRIDSTTRGALALVRVYHHEHLAQFPVAGTAEGVVNGTRSSLPLDFTRTSRDGVWAVRGDIPREGTWVLAIHGTDGVSGARVSILAALAAGNREIATVRVPRARGGNWPRAAADSDVEYMLEVAAAVATVQNERAGFRGVTIGEAAMGIGGALLVPLGYFALRRRRETAIPA